MTWNSHRGLHAENHVHAAGIHGDAVIKGAHQQTQFAPTSSEFKAQVIQ